MRPHEILSDLGNCREVGLDIMYPPDDDPRLIAIAKSVCDNCVVIDLCREEAMKGREHGVWAGMTLGEREYLGRKINRANRDERRLERQSRRTG